MTTVVCHHLPATHAVALQLVIPYHVEARRRDHGTAHLVEHLLCHAVSDQPDVDVILTWFNGQTSPDFIRLSALALPQNLRAARRMLLEVAGCLEEPARMRPYFSAGKAAVLTEIGSQDTDPIERCIRSLVRGWLGPKAWTAFPAGTSSSVRSQVCSSVERFVRGSVQHERVELHVAGDLEDASPLPLMQQQMSWQMVRPDPVYVVHGVDYFDETLVLVALPMGSCQSDLDLLAMHALAQLLHQGQAVTTLRGSLFEICHRFEANLTHTRPVSYVDILAWTGPRTAPLLLERIVSYLAGIRGGLSDTEIQAARDRLVLWLRSTQDIPHDFLTSMCHDFGMQSPTRLLNELETISQASLRRAMEDLLQERPSVVVLGPHRKGSLRLRDVISAHWDSRRQTGPLQGPRPVPSR